MRFVRPAVSTISFLRFWSASQLQSSCPWHRSLWSVIVDSPSLKSGAEKSMVSGTAGASPLTSERVRPFRIVESWDKLKVFESWNFAMLKPPFLWRLRRPWNPWAWAWATTTWVSTSGFEVPNASPFSYIKKSWKLQTVRNSHHQLWRITNSNTTRYNDYGWWRFMWHAFSPVSWRTRLRGAAVVM